MKAVHWLVAGFVLLVLSRRRRQASATVGEVQNVSIVPDPIRQTWWGLP